MTTTAVSITVEELGPVTRMLNVEVPVDRVNQARGSVISELRQHAKVPGFRPGKAPLQVLEKNYKEDIERTLFDRLVQDSIGEAVEQYDGKILNVRDIKPESLEKSASFKYGAIVEIPPEIKLGTYKKIKVLKPKIEVGDQQVDDVLSNLQERNMTFRPAEADESIAEKDKVTLTYHAFDQGELVPDGHVHDHEAQIGAGGSASEV